MTTPEQPVTTLIDELLAEQQSLTAVDRFSRRYAADGVPAQEPFYRDLIPLTKPKPGEQYAFEVDLDQCSGCKACVAACHSLNGLDEDETWRSVGLLFSADWRAPQQQTITTACHHCVEPGCLEGCPVLAYDKDPLTGIVRHLDDQCIGCQYCVMKCPYEVPQYSKQRGIVRKCDLCANRLAVGEAPACVQACPHEAIRITVVEPLKIKADFHRTEVVGQASRLSVGRLAPGASIAGETPGPAGGTPAPLPERLPRNLFLPNSPDPRITLPTTRYKSSTPLPDHLLSGDHARASPAPAHFPLVFMLVLIQLAAGASVAAVFAPSARLLSFVALGVSTVALAIASLHLGKPLKAWRAFLGWRKSWFSREVIAFAGFVPLTALNAAALWFMPLAPLQKPIAVAAALAGLLAVACSAMIYADTRRDFWSVSECFGRFFGTTLLLGTAAALTLTDPLTPPLIALLFVATVTKLGFEHRITRHLVDVNALTLTPLNKTARLLADDLGFAARLRVACGVIGGTVLPVLLALNHATPMLTLLALTLCLTGELLERYLFFTAVAPVKMPGGVAS